MTLEINATLVFGFSPNDKKNHHNLEEFKTYYQKLFDAIGFQVFLAESVHSDEGNRFLPQAASLNLQLSVKGIEFPALYNLLKIAEASLSLFPKMFDPVDFRYSVS